MKLLSESSLLENLLLPSWKFVLLSFRLNHQNITKGKITFYIPNAIWTHLTTSCRHDIQPARRPIIWDMKGMPKGSDPKVRAPSSDIFSHYNLYLVNTILLSAIRFSNYTKNKAFCTRFEPLSLNGLCTSIECRTPNMMWYEK